MRRRTYLAAGAAAVLGLAGCFAAAGGDETEESPSVGGEAGTPTDTATPADDATPTDSPTSTGTPVPVIGFIEHEWTVITEYESDAVDDTYGVKGRAVNNADTAVDVFIEATFYNDDGVQIGDSIDTASNVKSGGEFTFELPYLEDDADAVADYELMAEAYEA